MSMDAAGEINRDGELWTLLLEAVSVNNVLPLTSCCNMSCIFCSHRSNTPQVKTFSFPPLPPALLRELIPFLDGSRKIIIGESTTRLCEGEPLTHPHFLVLLKEVREMFPQTPLQITTNGALFQRSLVKELAALCGDTVKGQRQKNGQGDTSPDLLPGNLEVVVSLNCISKKARAKVMGDRKPAAAPEGIAYLKEEGLTFHGSIVALPHLTGWEELENTLLFLDEAGAQTSRVFLPGFTRFTEPRAQYFTFSLWKELLVFLRELAEQIGHPIIPEPPLKKDLRATVEGVIRSSPANRAGIVRGDVISRINGEDVFTGVEAFFKIRDTADPLVAILRGPSEPTRSVSEKNNSLPWREVCIAKKAGEPSGLVIYYDLSREDIEKVQREIERKKANFPLLLTSTAAEPLWEAALREGLLPDNTSLEAVKNYYWGGTICCTGLLTVVDLEVHLRKKFSKGVGPDLVIIPLSPFDKQGRDLLGRSLDDLSPLIPQASFSFL